MDKELKQKVNAEWQNAFPLLCFYDQNKLYKVVGPIIIGLELIKSPFTDAYSPYFVIYLLWKESIKASLEYPILLKNFKNRKGFQYDIPYEKHTVFFDDVVDSITKQGPLSFEGNISFRKVIDILGEYSKTPPLSAAPNSYLQASLQEAILKIALFIDAAEAQNVLEQIENRNWDENHFKACGWDVKEWLQSLRTTIFNRDEFLKQVEVNKQNKKIAKLKSSELTA